MSAGTIEAGAEDDADAVAAASDADAVEAESAATNAPRTTEFSEQASACDVWMAGTRALHAPDDADDGTVSTNGSKLVLGGGTSTEAGFVADSAS